MKKYIHYTHADGHEESHMSQHMVIHNEEHGKIQSSHTVETGRYTTEILRYLQHNAHFYMQLYSVFLKSNEELQHHLHYIVKPGEHHNRLETQMLHNTDTEIYNVHKKFGIYTNNHDTPSGITKEVLLRKQETSHELQGRIDLLMNVGNLSNMSVIKLMDAIHPYASLPALGKKSFVYNETIYQCIMNAIVNGVRHSTSQHDTDQMNLFHNDVAKSLERTEKLCKGYLNYVQQTDFSQHIKSMTMQYNEHVNKSINKTAIGHGAVETI